MSIFGYYARDNKEAIYKNRISALERLMKQYGEDYPYYLIWKAELLKAKEKLERVRG